MEQKSSSLFDIIIWSGAAISLLGLLGIIWCILRVSKAKRSDLSDDALRAVLQSIIPVNLGALFLSIIGLIMVVIGITLS